MSVFDDGKPTKHELDKKKLTIRQEAKLNRKLADATFGQIVWHLYRRHELGLTRFALIATVGFGFYKWLT